MFESPNSPFHNMSVAVVEKMYHTKYNSHGQSSDNEYRKELKKLYDLSNSKPPTLPWVKIKDEYICIHLTDDDENGIFCKLDSLNQEFWHLFQHSIPYYVNSRYYNLKGQGASNECVNLIQLSCSMLVWNEFLGIEHLNDVFQMYKKLDDVVTKKCSWTFSEESRMALLVDQLMLTWSGVLISPPEGEHLSSEAGEFLLEPCIHMQLPWKPMLLQQWLAAALAEVLVFERDSMELRHCPIREEVADVAESVVTVVRQLKERILLGFAILNQQITSYPEVVDPKLPSYVLDEVVLPSVPILEFLIKKEAHRIVESLKQISSESSEGKVYLPEKCFQLDPSLASLHHNFAFNFPMWSGDKLTTPFPVVFEDLADIISRMKSPEVSLTSTPDILSLDEQHLFKMIGNTIKTEKLSINDRIKHTIKIIDNEIIKKEIIVGVTEEDVVNKFTGCKRQSREILDLRKSDNIHLALRYALMFEEVVKLLPCCEKMISVVSQIITIQLEIVLEEIRSKLAKICSLIFNTSIQFSSKHISPKNSEDLSSPDIATTSNTINEPLVNLEDLKLQLNTVKTEIENQNRNKFWDSFPDEWKTPINKAEEIPSEKIEDLDTTVIKLMIRIQKVAFQVCKINFELVEKNCQIIQYSSLDHYVIPNLISVFVQNCKENNSNMPYIKIVHALIQLCEYKCHETAVNINNNANDGKHYCPVHGDSYILDNINETTFIRDRLFIGIFKKQNNIEEDQFINNINHILYYLLDCVCVNESKNYLFWNLYHHSKRLKEKLYDLHLPISYILSYVCNIPNPNDVIKKHKLLGELYLLTLMNCDLEILYDLRTKDNTNKDNLECPLYKYNVKTLRQLFLSTENDRLEIIKFTIEIYNDNNYELENINRYCEDKLKNQYKLYEKLINYRKKCIKDSPCNIEKLPYCKIYKEVEFAILLYLNGRYNDLHQLFTTFENIKKDELLDSFKRCHECNRPENKILFKMLTCEKCIEDNYPEVNYYCSNKCKNERWISEHMAEHLEFELGVSQYHVLNVKSTENGTEESESMLKLSRFFQM